MKCKYSAGADLLPYGLLMFIVLIRAVHVELKKKFTTLLLLLILIKIFMILVESE